MEGAPEPASPSNAAARARWASFAAQAQPVVDTRLEDAEVEETRKQLSRLLNTNLMDFKHHHPLSLEKCLSTLFILCRNIASSPTQEKYRRV